MILIIGQNKMCAKFRTLPPKTVDIISKAIILTEIAKTGEYNGTGDHTIS